MSFKKVGSFLAFEASSLCSALTGQAIAATVLLAVSGLILLGVDIGEKKPTDSKPDDRPKKK